MTLADNIRTIALGEVGQKYVLGEEGLGYAIGGEQTGDKRDTDCSGHVYSVLRKAGATWKSGGTFQRLSADGYWQLVEKIDKPSRVGDVGLIVNSKGKAVHVILYVGRKQTT